MISMDEVFPTGLAAFGQGRKLARKYNSKLLALNRHELAIQDFISQTPDNHDQEKKDLSELLKAPGEIELSEIEPVEKALPKIESNETKPIGTREIALDSSNIESILFNYFAESPRIPIRPCTELIELMKEQVYFSSSFQVDRNRLSMSAEKLKFYVSKLFKLPQALLTSHSMLFLNHIDELNILIEKHDQIGKKNKCSNTADRRFFRKRPNHDRKSKLSFKVLKDPNFLRGQELSDVVYRDILDSGQFEFIAVDRTMAPMKLHDEPRLPGMPLNSNRSVEAVSQALSDSLLERIFFVFDIGSFFYGPGVNLLAVLTTKNIYHQLVTLQIEKRFTPNGLILQSFQKLAPKVVNHILSERLSFLRKRNQEWESWLKKQNLMNLVYAKTHGNFWYLPAINRSIDLNISSPSWRFLMEKSWDQLMSD